MYLCRTSNSFYIRSGWTFFQIWIYNFLCVYTTHQVLSFIKTCCYTQQINSCTVARDWRECSWRVCFEIFKGNISRPDYPQNVQEAYVHNQTAIPLLLGERSYNNIKFSMHSTLTNWKDQYGWLYVMHSLKSLIRGLFGK